MSIIIIVVGPMGAMMLMMIGGVMVRRHRDAGGIRLRSAYNSPAAYGEQTHRDYEALVKAGQDKRIRVANTKE